MACSGFTCISLVKCWLLCFALRRAICWKCAAGIWVGLRHFWTWKRGGGALRSWTRRALSAPGVGSVGPHHFCLVLPQKAPWQHLADKHILPLTSDLGWSYPHHPALPSPASFQKKPIPTRALDFSFLSPLGESLCNSWSCSGAAATLSAAGEASPPSCEVFLFFEALDQSEFLVCFSKLANEMTQRLSVCEVQQTLAHTSESFSSESFWSWWAKMFGTAVCGVP